jgi:hypothetical protein
MRVKTADTWPYGQEFQLSRMWGSGHLYHNHCVQDAQFLCIWALREGICV